MQIPHLLQMLNIYHIDMAVMSKSQLMFIALMFKYSFNLLSHFQRDSKLFD